MDKAKLRQYSKKTWHFLWHEDSIWSWLVNIVLAFVLIKYVVYPGLGFLLGTSFPVVAVISESMEHDATFEAWWEAHESLYEEAGITRTMFEKFPFRNGFEKGDIMVIVGKDPEAIAIGEVIVFQSDFRREPIIHRVIAKQEDGETYLQTKGDKNFGTYPFERAITREQIYGRAIFRIPLLGYVKILFMELLQLIGVVR